MLEIWINGNSMKSLSNHVPVWYKYKEKRQYIWMDFKYARKLDVGLRISFPNDKFMELQVMRWAITHRPQDLPRSKHILAEGKTLEEVTILSKYDLIGVTQNLRVVKER